MFSLSGRGPRDVILCVLLLVTTGCATSKPRQWRYRFYPDTLKQTIDFEIDVLPGQVFKIVIPEIITDFARLGPGE